jgi:hypothetical protein
MVRHSNGRAVSLLDSAGPGTCRPGDSLERSRSVSPQVEVDEGDDALVLRVRLCEGPLELRVPRDALKARHRHPHLRGHIPGFNADATPC